MKDSGDWIRRTCQYLLDKSVNLYAPEQRSWGRAASAEVHSMPSSFSALRWTHSALWLAIRAGLARLLHRPGDALLGTNTLLRRNWPSLSPLLLALSLCFFLAPQFRQALQVTTSIWMSGDPQPGLSEHTFRKLQANAEREHDAKTLAFLAFHPRDRRDSIRLAGDAVALDPELTWIFGQIQDYGASRIPPQWFEQLEQWDPDNAFPYLLHASSLRGAAQIAEKKFTQAVLEEMRTSDSPFRRLMQRGFAAPRYDSYLARRLELERDVMRRHGLAKPLLLLEGVQSSRLPSFLDVQTYARWLIAEAKVARHGAALPPEDAYRQVLRTGASIEAESKTSFERLQGGALQQMAARELIPLLRAQSRTEEANTLDYTLERIKQSQQRDTVLEGALLDPQYARIYRPNIFNPGIIIHLAALTFILALVLLTACWLFLRFRSANDGEAVALPHLVAYTPLFLFSSALVMLVTYLPYARIFQMYLVGQETARGLTIGPLKDPRLLSTLSNLQTPFLFLTGSEIHWTLGIAVVSVLMVVLYCFKRMRATPAQA